MRRPRLAWLAGGGIIVGGAAATCIYYSLEVGVGAGAVLTALYGGTAVWVGPPDNPGSSKQRDDHSALEVTPQVRYLGMEKREPASKAGAKDADWTVALTPVEEALQAALGDVPTIDLVVDRAGFTYADIPIPHNINTTMLIIWHAVLKYAFNSGRIEKVDEILAHALRVRPSVELQRAVQDWRDYHSLP